MAGVGSAAQSLGPASCVGRRSQKLRAPVEPPQLCVRGSTDAQFLARSFASESTCRRAPPLHSFAQSCDASAASSSSASWHHARGRPVGLCKSSLRSGLASGLSTLCGPSSALGERSDVSRRGRSLTECSAVPTGRPDSTVSTAAVSLGTEATPAVTHKVDVHSPGDSPVENPSSSVPSLSKDPQNGAASEQASSSTSLSTWNPLAFLEAKLPPRVRGLVLLNILTFLYGELACLCSRLALLLHFMYSCKRSALFGGWF